MELIKNFNEIKKTDSLLAGGKGSSLGEMTQAGLPVPDGFVVLSGTFDRFLHETDLAQEIEAILKTVDHKAIHTVEGASEKIRGLIENEELPQDISDEILRASKALRAEFVAVRSSATAEDGAEHAWAGQLESYLNTTEDDLLDKVKKCWSSLFTPRAIFYRFEKELHGTDISVAVVVQKMVQSEVSGIAFSVHPITEDRNQLIIEAGFGLGEAIVSGSITPDSYVVEKESRQIIDTTVNTQRRGLYKSRRGENEWKEIPEPKASSQVLNVSQIMELADLVIKIENHYGFPCDIEWAYEDGKFYITQSRPITTLSNKTPIRHFKKFFTRKLSLVTMEYWWEGEYDAFNKLLQGSTRFNPLFIKTSDGNTSVYYDINNPDTAIKPLFDFFINNPDKFRPLAKKFEEDYKKLHQFAINYRNTNIKDFYKTSVDFWGFLPVIVQFGNSTNKELPKAIIEKSYKLRELSQAGEYEHGDALIGAIKFQYPDLAEYANVISIKELLSNKIPNKETLDNRNDFFIFFEGNITTGKDLEKFQEENNILIDEDLSIIGEFSEKKSLFKKNVSRDVCVAAIEFWEKSDTEYLENWIGVTTDRLVYERANGMLTVYEDEKIFADATKAIKKKLARSGWVEEITENYQKALKEIKKLESQLLSKPNKKNLEVFFEKLARTQSLFAIIYFVPAIEDAPSKAKEACLEQRKSTEDFFYNANATFEKAIPMIVPDYAIPFSKILSINEILGMLPTVDELRKRDEHFIFHDHKFYYNRTLIQVERELGIEIEKDEVISGTNEIRGNVAHKGISKGKVVIVLTKTDINRVNEGDIMVTPMTNPDFLPAMKKASAFVTDEGGVTSHAAITAREMGKPCIIGTKIATKVLKDGDLVEVNADTGVIKIIENNLGIKDPNYYQRLFQVGGMPYIISDIFMTEYKKIKGFSMLAHGIWTTYLPKQSIKDTLIEGVELYSSKEKFDEYSNGFEAYKKKTAEHFEKISKKDRLTRADLEEFLINLSTLFHFYRRTEFFATDDAYQYSLNDEITSENLKHFERIKNSGREYLNKLFFGSESALFSILSILQKQFRVEVDSLMLYSRSDLLNLFENQKVSTSILEDRKCAYVMIGDGENLTYINGKEAEVIVSKFDTVTPEFHSEIKGKTANKGKVRGMAKVIIADYGNFDGLKKIMESMVNGDILIAETTSPELMPVCSKASAIVTNQGGMMSHAAIVSREMNIPCVVGTGNATDLIKDGDIVEVDGNKGVVHIIQKAQRD